MTSTVPSIPSLDVPVEEIAASAPTERERIISAAQWGYQQACKDIRATVKKPCWPPACNNHG